MSLGPYPAPVHLAGAIGPQAPTDADVVILALDRAEETIAAIASARAQTGVAKHVWIADQGSKPENLARLAAAVEGAPDATLVRLDRDGTSEVLLTAADGLDIPTDADFGVKGRDRFNLYITNGAYTILGPSAGNASVMRLHLGVPGAPSNH